MIQLYDEKSLERAKIRHYYYTKFLVYIFVKSNMFKLKLYQICIFVGGVILIIVAIVIALMVEKKKNIALAQARVAAPANMYTDSNRRPINGQGNGRFC